MNNHDHHGFLLLVLIVCLISLMFSVAAATYVAAVERPTREMAPAPQPARWYLQPAGNGAWYAMPAPRS